MKTWIQMQVSTQHKIMLKDRLALKGKEGRKQIQCFITSLFAVVTIRWPLLFSSPPDGEVKPGEVRKGKGCFMLFYLLHMYGGGNTESSSDSCQSNSFENNRVFGENYRYLTSINVTYCIWYLSLRHHGRIQHFLPMAFKDPLTTYIRFLKGPQLNCSPNNNCQQLLTSSPVKLWISQHAKTKYRTLVREVLSV